MISPFSWLKETPLILAVKHRNVKILIFLSWNRSRYWKLRMKEVDYYFMTPIQKFIIHSLKSERTVNERNDTDYGPFQSIVHNGWVEIAQIWLKIGPMLVIWSNRSKLLFTLQRWVVLKFESIICWRITLNWNFLVTPAETLKCCKAKWSFSSVERDFSQRAIQRVRRLNFLKKLKTSYERTRRLFKIFLPWFWLYLDFVEVS
jgi:hypothetical protein